jgi:hypothetical protein
MQALSGAFCPVYMHLQMRNQFRRCYDLLGAEIAKPQSGIGGEFVMIARYPLLSAIAACWLATTATADAQHKMTVTIVTQPFGTQPQFTKVDQPILRDGLKAKSNGRR